MMMNRMSFLPRLAAQSRALLSRPPARRLVSRSVQRSGSPHHGPAGPYDAPHHPTYPTQAHPFGIDPAVPYQWEGWEAMTAVTYFLMFGIFATIFATKDVDEFSSWARREALAREAVRAGGGEVEYGKWYQHEQFVDGELQEAPGIEDK